MRDEANDPHASPEGERRLAELAALFFRLGLTAFGGPAAHIAMMEEEVVRRRKWLSHAEFLDMLGATNLIPGPNSTEMAIHIGHKRAGWAGLLVAGACFIVPAVTVTLALAWVYVRFGKIPQAGGVLYGIKPVMIAVVLQALWSLGKSAIKSRPLGALGAAAALAAAAGVEELAILFGGGALAAMWPSGSKPPPTRPDPEESKPPPSNLANLALGGTAGLGGASTAVASSWSLFLVFAKIGSILFGSGYVLLAFLRADLVERHHWMTEAQLVDAIAVGQLTPGPVFTTATFVGYVIHGLPGATAATAGIFLPAFVFVALSGPLIPRLRASKRAGAFLDGVNVTSLALMAVVTFQLGRTALVDVVTILIAACATFALIKWKVSSVWLILGGAVVGAVWSAL